MSAARSGTLACGSVKARSHSGPNFSAVSAISLYISFSSWDWTGAGTSLSSENKRLSEQKSGKISDQGQSNCAGLAKLGLVRVLYAAPPLPLAPSISFPVWAAAATWENKNELYIEPPDNFQKKKQHTHIA